MTPEAYADAVIAGAGAVVWIYGLTHNDAVAVNVGFLAVAVIVGTRVGLI